MSKLGLLSVLSTTVLLLSGCATQYPPTTQALTLSPLHVLSQQLEETSGLYCTDDRLFTINDSGNEAKVFELNYDGLVTQTYPLPLRNIDWEAITGDDEFLYIADIGNNKGKRETLMVHKVSRRDYNHVDSFSIQYAGNEPSDNFPYAHDFDAEAMVLAEGKLLIFSKSWRTGIANVYEVGSETQQILTPIAHIAGLPGVITGADFDEVRNLYVVVGYKSDPFGNFSTFLAQLDTSFTPVEVWPLDEYKQVEGICVDKQGDYWFSEEATDLRKASLTRASIK
ncbi:MAG: hypothetical protein CL593_03820 [Alteromonas sp.]|uniref:hypothetical protein n=1 Tax=Alteromonas australica TaxID=589873 RepID=UPI000C4E0826|nr:hypothetical protein [Alteromonas australica]MAB92471.1 hypothetical protein [Alteromonas sp.]MBU33102.1 hypothetical protein [Alteromonas sp.]